MPAIRSMREEVTDRFSVLSFLVRTDGRPYFQVALATDPGLFSPARKNDRTPENFYSTRGAGLLPAERGEAVYMVPSSVLQRFAGNPRLFYGLAVFSTPTQEAPDVIRVPDQGSHWIGLSSFSGEQFRRMPLMRGWGLTGPSGSYGRDDGALTWAGDMPQPGMEDEIPKVSMAPGTPENTPPFEGEEGRGAASSEAGAFRYDDGFGPMSFSEKDDDALYGIEGPIPDGVESAEEKSYARSLSSAEYPQADRFVAAHASNYRRSSGKRTIRRIVIHITDGGSNINGTIGWFQNPSSNVSAHYIVGQDGEVVQMVKHDDVAWHARTANADSIGIEHVANTKGLLPTEAQYCASAALVAWLADEYGLPIDRNHIQGHSEADPKTSHTGCPNAVWDWNYFMGVVTSRSCSSKSEAPTEPLGASREGTDGDIESDSVLKSGDLILVDGSDSMVSSSQESVEQRSYAVLHVGEGKILDGRTARIEEKPAWQVIPTGPGALVLRHAQLTPSVASRIREAARSSIGSPADRWADVLYSSEVDQPHSGDTSQREFRCPEFVIAAFEQGRVSLTVNAPTWNGPSTRPRLMLSPDVKAIGEASVPSEDHPTLSASSQNDSARNGPLTRGEALAVVELDYAPSDPEAAKRALAEFSARKKSWRSGVSDTSFMPHSAICHLEMTFDDGKKYLGTGTYIGPGQILTAAHNIEDKVGGHRALQVDVIPGRNGMHGEPFGRFSIQGSDCIPHPRYDGGHDFDLAVLKAPKPPPNGAYLEVLEDLAMSTHDTMIVCGYAAESVDAYTQHLDGDFIRDVAENLETFRYNLQTEKGSSGSAVFYISGFEDEERRQSVLEERIIGVHVAPSTKSLNKGCRLTEEKIAWIRSVEGHGGSHSSSVSVPAHLTSQAAQAVEIVSAIAGATMSRILDNKGDITWELDQLRGLKHPFGEESYKDKATFKSQTLKVRSPRLSTVFGVDDIYADMEIAFDFNGHSLGNVQIVVTDPNDAYGEGLAVAAQIMDDANTYKMPGDERAFAALKVRVQYRFTNDILSDSISVTDIVLYGNGKHDARYRWTALRAL